MYILVGNNRNKYMYKYITTCNHEPVWKVVSIAKTLVFQYMAAIGITHELNYININLI